MGRAFIAFALAAGVAALIAWATMEPDAAPAPPVAAVVATVEDAGVQQAPLETPDAAVPPPAAPLPPPMLNGFCAANGDPDTFQRKFSLKTLLATERGQKPEVKKLLEAAVAAAHAGDDEGEAALLRRARELLPHDPALGLELARVTRDTGALDEAIDGLADYLAADPQPALGRLKARLEVQRDIQRGDQREERGGITVLWPAPMTAVQADELAREVDRDLDEAARLSGTRRRQKLTVVVYSDRSELLAVACIQNWSAALYDGSLRVVANISSDGFDRKTVKHETLHAQVGPLAPKAPRWFHEGLAQSFAQQSSRDRKWRLMVRNRVWVPFSSLDGTFEVFDSDSDAELAYAQSYAMVEMMRELGGDAAVSVALQAFAEGASTPVVFARACKRADVSGEDLLEFMQRRLQR